MPPTTKELLDHIHRIQIRTTREVNSLFAGVYHSAFKGRGIEFEDVREYQPGDEVKNIDWNLTARMQHPYIKNFREERELTVMLAVDVSASTLYGSSEQSKNEIIADIGAIIAFSAIQNHDKVGLLLFSDEIELYLKPKKNVKHVLRVIRELLFFKPKHKGTNIPHALTFLGKLERHHSICFVISDFLTDNLGSKETSILSKYHELIFVEVYDDFENAFPNLGLINMKSLESEEGDLIDTDNPLVQNHFKEQARQKRIDLKRQAEKSNVGFISIGNKDSLTGALRKFFKLRGKKH